jgi:16S rRNA G1207 methylase RsmC
MLPHISQTFYHSYGGSRPDLQLLAPQTSERILDVGCCPGTLGKALKERQGIIDTWTNHPRCALAQPPAHNQLHLETAEA